MSMQEFYCFSCGTQNQVVAPVGRREECAKCGADVHVCKNCDFYDPNQYNECRETSADVVREKDRANYCDFFQLNSGRPDSGPKKEDLLSAAEALFKK